MDVSFQAFTLLILGKMFITLKLLVRRPIYRFFSAVPPPADASDVLQVATEVMEWSLLRHIDPDMAPWSWFAEAKWYALAVPLAELCSNSNGEHTGRAGTLPRPIPPSCLSSWATA